MLQQKVQHSGLCCTLCCAVSICFRLYLRAFGIFAAKLAFRETRVAPFGFLAVRTFMLSDEELDRYARHLVLREVGGVGQARIRAAKVLIVGAGGLGSPVALYLAAAGIGRLGLVDDDTVSLSNLQRQILFRTQDVGRAKVEAGGEALKALNPGVQIDCHHTRLTAANALELIARLRHRGRRLRQFRHPLPAQ